MTPTNSTYTIIVWFRRVKKRKNFKYIWRILKRNSIRMRILKLKPIPILPRQHSAELWNVVFQYKLRWNFFFSSKWIWNLKFLLGELVKGGREKGGKKANRIPLKLKKVQFLQFNNIFFPECLVYLFVVESTLLLFICRHIDMTFQYLIPSFSVTSIVHRKVFQNDFPAIESEFEGGEREFIQTLEWKWIRF